MLLPWYLIVTVLLIMTASVIPKPSICCLLQSIIIIILFVSPVSPPSLSSSSTTTRQLRSVTTDPVILWPNGLVPFEIDAKLHKTKSNIRDAMNEYMQKTCIHFTPRTNETAYILFTKNDEYGFTFDK